MAKRKTEQQSNKFKETPSYAGIYELKDTAEMMNSSDYKVRFIAEYIQLKVRYEKLKFMLNRWDAFPKRFGIDNVEESGKEFSAWMGFKPSCDYTLLRDQQYQMGELLHTLEVRSIIEGIDLKLVTIKL